ncbi:MAG: DUF1054 family protein [Deltaproteobacteria bacterium]|nr:DUF1054 family protein [Deltaproteobacteria bacterium]
MTSLLSRDDLAVFTIPSLDDRLAAIRDRVAPTLADLGRALIDELAVRTGEELHCHAAVHARQKKNPPDETWIALGPTPRQYKKEPYFAVGISRNAVHVRVQISEECPRKVELGQVIVERSPELARHAQHLGALRNFEGWDHEGLPDPAPAAERLFWSTLGNRLVAKKNARFDIGVGWKGAEALRLSKQRIADAIVRLMPLYHFVVFDRWRF